MHDVKSLIKEVLEQGHLMSLAVTSEKGPWVADVIYVHDDDLNLYWMSDPTVWHSEAIVKDPRVAGTITVSNKSKELNLGIQFHGVARKIEGARHDLAVLHMKKRGNPEPKHGDDVLQGDSWYMLEPTRIELIHEKLFGYEKKIVVLKNS